MGRKLLLLPENDFLVCLFKQVIARSITDCKINQFGEETIAQRYNIHHHN